MTPKNRKQPMKIPDTIRGAVRTVLEAMMLSGKNLKLRTPSFYGIKRGEAIERYTSPDSYNEKIASGIHGAGLNIIHGAIMISEMAFNEVSKTDDIETDPNKDDMVFTRMLTDIIVKSGNIKHIELNRSKLTADILRESRPEVPSQDYDFATNTFGEELEEPSGENK